MQMLNAHTLPLACDLQEEILKWLKDVKEVSAYHWFEKYWIGSQGNYTNASAGFCGTNSVQGIESRWRYLKRDACGGSSGTKSLPLKVFVPALLTYMKTHSGRHWKTHSGRHCEQLLNTSKTNPAGTHVAMAFPSDPTITSEMWKGAQNLDVRTLQQQVQLSYLECNPPLRRAFSKVADQISGYGESETPILRSDCGMQMGTVWRRFRGPTSRVSLSQQRTTSAHSRNRIVWP